MASLRHLLIITLFTLATAARSQTVVWQLHPADYSDMQPYTAGFYTFTQGGHTGILRADGSVAVPARYDIISPYHDGKALLLIHEGGRNRVGGYITTDIRYVPFQKNYYTLAGIDFYSCGMLPVADSRGRKGYLDENGTEAIGFNGTFDQIMPFSEDYATVFRGNGKNKKYALIDRHGNPVAFRLGLGEVYSGTNVYKGRAIIWDTNGKFYAYNTATGQCSTTSKPNNINFDYLYCFIGVSNRTREIPYTNVTPPAPNGVQPTVGANGLYGYNAPDGHEVLPPQFSHATAFTDNIAIVTIGNRRGLLRWVPSVKSFAVANAQGEYTYKPGQKVTCQLRISTPEAWADHDVTFEVTDAATGENMAGTLAQDTYTFTITPKPMDKAKDICVTARAEGLTLWSGTTQLQLRSIEEKLHIAIHIPSDIANKSGNVPVNVTITNPGAADVTTKVHITGSNTLIESHQTVTVPAHGTANVSTAFHISSDVSDQYVNVTTSQGASASRKGLRFETYY